MAGQAEWRRKHRQAATERDIALAETKAQAAATLAARERVAELEELVATSRAAARTEQEAAAANARAEQEAERAKALLAEAEVSRLREQLRAMQRPRRWSGSRLRRRRPPMTTG